MEPSNNHKSAISSGRSIILISFCKYRQKHMLQVNMGIRASDETFCQLYSQNYPIYYST